MSSSMNAGSSGGATFESSGAPDSLAPEDLVVDPATAGDGEGDNPEETEETRIRCFHYVIDKIAVACEAKIDDCFLEFEIGGQSIEDETEEVIEKPKMKKTRLPDGTVEEKEVMETVNLKMTRVKKTPVQRYMSYKKRVIKAKTTEKFVFDRIEGYWWGSYDDLMRESVTIRVWTARILGGNALVGEATERFIDIADSKVDRSVNVRKRAHATREETVCVVRYKCELQEWFQFAIKFQSWGLSYVKEEAEAGRMLLDTGCPTPCFASHLDFYVARSQATWAQALMMWLCCCCRDDSSWLKLRENMKTANGSGSDAVAVVAYPGTRTWLEDEDLDIRWQKGIFGGYWCCKTTVAHARVPLQGTLDYGYILTRLPVRREACSADCCCDSCRACCVSACSLTRVCFGPTCNCGRSGYTALGQVMTREQSLAEKAEEDRKSKENFVNMTLAGVVMCDTVPRHRQQGSVDPARGSSLFSQSATQATFLVVKVIRAKGLASVDTFKEVLNPSVTAEWLGIQKRTKTVYNNSAPFWDYDVFFKIRDESGAPRRYEDFTEAVRSSSLTLTVWDEENLSHNVLGFAEIPFRDIFEKREDRMIHIFTSDTKVPHLVYEAKLPLSVPYTQVAEDRRARESKMLLESEHRYLEVQVYFDRIDAISIDNRRVGVEAPPPSLAASERQRIKQYSRARALWSESLRHVELRERRFFAFFGKDEYTGDFHFLPTFVKPMHPPANMKDLSEIFYYVFSMEVAQKPPVEADEARRKRAIALQDPCSPILHNDVWVWADPYFFFEKKRGDIKDHAILLCNFLLGLGLPPDQFNAFVCVGTARTKRGALPIPHVWVMTQELFPHQKRPVIRFWELKSGETFALEGPRFSEVYQHDRSRAARAVAAELEAAQAGLAAGKDKAKGKDGKGGKGKGKGKGGKRGKNDEEDEDGEGETNEEDSTPKLGPDGKPLKDMSWDTVGRRMEDELAEFDPNDDAALLGLVSDKPVRVAPAAVSGSVYTAATEARAEGEREGAQHRLALLREFVAEQEQRFPNPKDRFWEASDGRSRRRVTPYESIDVIFNHECLFANLQQANPEVIMYELDKDKRWVEFSEPAWQECFGFHALAPFYNERAIVSILTPERTINRLVREMTSQLLDSIITHRSYLHQFETVTFDRFDFVGTVAGIDTAEDYARQRLSLERVHGLRDESLRSLDAERSNDPADKALLRTQPAKLATQLRAKVSRNLKNGVEFQERLFHFKHTDVNRIGDQVRAQCADLLAFPDAMEPRFQLFVDIERLAGQVCPVRVLMLVTYAAATRKKGT